MANAPSPFIPGTKLQYVWDSMSIGWLKECPRKYQYYVIDGWAPKDMNVHLWFGLLYHSALEKVDKLKAEGRAHWDAVREVMLDLLAATWVAEPEQQDADGRVTKEAVSKPYETGDTYKNRVTLVRSFIWYCINYESDPAKTLVLANGQPAVELVFKYELDFGPRLFLFGFDTYEQNYVLTGHLDRLVSFAGQEFVTDRKSTKSNLHSQYFDHYSPDSQMSHYALAGQIIYPGPLKGVLIDATQVAVGFSRFGRGLAHRSFSQLDEWRRDLRVFLRAAESFALDEYWPMNDKSCHNYGGCEFRQVCSKDPVARDAMLRTHYERRWWNPLADRGGGL